MPQRHEHRDDELILEPFRIILIEHRPGAHILFIIIRPVLGHAVANQQLLAFRHVPPVVAVSLHDLLGIVE